MLRFCLRLPALALLTLPLACKPAADGDDEIGQDASDTGGETVETSDTSGEDQYRATIRRTSHGIPHITADDFGSLGFGQGYAFTQDKGCYLADQVVKVRSQRARYFGAGEGFEHVYSDFAYLQLHVVDLAETQLPVQSEQIQAIVRGYAAGFNAALAAGEIGGDCDGQDWVTALTPTDLFAYYIDLGLLASSRQAISAIGSAQPPNGGAPAPAPLGESAGSQQHASTFNSYRGRLGSNGWGIGSDISASGRGMVMGNPHFPWEGELQLWESHLRIPGEFEVYGVGLLGVPGVLIGFNDAVAWTHTVSDGHRLTLYQITSPPGEPTKYYYDGEIRDMVSEDFTIAVKQGDGTLEQQTRTMWRTHYGPMAALEPFYWTDAFALSARDANIDNFVLLEQFLGMNAATSLEEFQQVHTDVAGVPWVNTMAASADGRAWYMDSTPTPNLSQAALDAWEIRKESGFTKALADQDIWLLETGARDEWQDDPGARSPGLIAPANLPELERTDYIFNANDSYWMTNPEQLLTGYSPLHGFAETGRSLRTRMNALTLQEIDAGMGFAGADGKLDLDELTAAALSNRGYTGEILRDQVIARCEGVGVWDVDGMMVDIAEACDAIAGWDGLLNLDSAGAVIWREWIGDYDYEVTFDGGGAVRSRVRCHGSGQHSEYLGPGDQRKRSRARCSRLCRVAPGSGRDRCRCHARRDAVCPQGRSRHSGHRGKPRRGGHESDGVRPTAQRSDPADSAGHGALRADVADRRGLPRQLRDQLHHGHAVHRRGPGGSGDPDLLGVGRGRLAVVQRSDRDVLGQAVAADAVDRGRYFGRPQLDRGRGQRERIARANWIRPRRASTER